MAGLNHVPTAAVLDGTTHSAQSPPAPGNTVREAEALLWVPDTSTAGRQRRSMPEPLSPPFRETEAREGKSPARGRRGGATGAMDFPAAALHGCA